MKVNCPTCKKEVEWTTENQFRPFCTKRCQLIDLGQWANEENAIPAGANKDAETGKIEISEAGLSAKYHF